MLTADILRDLERLMVRPGVPRFKLHQTEYCPRGTAYKATVFEEPLLVIHPKDWEAVQAAHPAVPEAELVAALVALCERQKA